MLNRTMLILAFRFATVPFAFAANVPVSMMPPGNFSSKAVPQFVLITHDDTVWQDTEFNLAKISRHKNPNGCNIKATLFVSMLNDRCGQGFACDGWPRDNCTGACETNCSVLHALMLAGHEIATHTFGHASTMHNWSTVDPEYHRRQVQLGVDWLADECGLPRDALQGFRAPYLAVAPFSMANVVKVGLKYDSSLQEVSLNESIHRSGRADQELVRQSKLHDGEFVWPYTLDHGVHIAAARRMNQLHRQIEPVPGLWEVPLWEILGQNHSWIMDYHSKADVPSLPASMDMGPLGPALEKALERRYHGNRAPLGIFLHGFSLLRHTEQLSGWIARTRATHPDVWFVTMSELVAWMENPVSKGAFNTNCSCTSPKAPPCSSAHPRSRIEATPAEIEAPTAPASEEIEAGLRRPTPDESIPLGKLRPTFDDSILLVKQLEFIGSLALLLLLLLRWGSVWLYKRISSREVSPETNP